MKIQCPACKLEYQIEDSLSNEIFECSCGAKFVNPEKVKQPTKRCPMCGENILAVAQKCKYCGEYLNEQIQMRMQVDRTVYTILGLFFGGIGVHNFYAGKGETLAGVGHILLWIIAFIFIGLSEGDCSVAVAVLALANLIWVIIELIRGPECYGKK